MKRIAIGSILGATLLVAGSAAAHRLHFPKRDEVTLSAKKISVTVSEDFEGDEAHRFRDRFDTNGDGRIDGSEAANGESLLAEHARRGLAVEVGGAAPKLAVTSHSSVGLDRPVASTDRLGVTLVLEAPALISGPTSVSFSDRTEAGDHEVPLAVTVDGLTVTTSRGRLESPPGATSKTKVLGIYLNPGETWTGTVALPTAGR